MSYTSASTLILCAPMNPSSHCLVALEVAPCTFSTKGALTNQFNLRLQYRPGGDYQLFIGVYVPEQLQPALLSGDATGLHIDTLEVNSLSSRLLPGWPIYVVLGVRCGDGNESTHIPAAFTTARRRRHIAGLVACVLGCGLLAAEEFLWLGAVALVIGTHVLRTAREIPFRPFRVFRSYR